MMSAFRNGRLESHSLSVGLLLLWAVALAAGCSSSNSQGGADQQTYHVDASGRSVPGWLVLPTGGAHASTAALDYIATGESACGECHGEDLSGGISNVSCYRNPAGCHHGPIPDWASPEVHGVEAKRAPGGSGFAPCQICHGVDFSGGGSGTSCFDCHTVNAPHPQRPWRGTGYTHADVDGRNAPVCAVCHFPGSGVNPPGHPFEPAAPGSEPGCFNNTLCHDSGVSGSASGN